MIAVNGPARPIWGLAEGRRGLVRLVESLAEHLGLEGWDVGLRLVDDAEMAEMNWTYRGLPGPTNVLSFPESEAAEAEMWEGVGGVSGMPAGFGADDGLKTLPAQARAAQPLSLGDIVLDLDAVARESRLYGQPVRTHLVRLLAHALLHLAGFEHGPEMELRTESAVAALGESPACANAEWTAP